jgi:hypothetical protein
MQGDGAKPRLCGLCSLCLSKLQARLEKQVPSLTPVCITRPHARAIRLVSVYRRLTEKRGNDRRNVNWSLFRWNNNALVHSANFHR